MREWTKHLEAALNGEQLEPSRLAEVREEIAQHLEDRYHALLAEGTASDEAEQKVIDELRQGALGAELRRVLRRPMAAEGDAASEGLFASGWRDLRYGFRQLRNTPGFTVVALLSLVLGIGANTAIFELLDAVRMRTLPVKDPQELVSARVALVPHGRTGSFRQVPDLTRNLFEALRDRQQVFRQLSPWAVTSADLNRTGEVRYGRVLFAGGDLFDTLGVSPLMGRAITTADDQRGCSPAPAVVSYGYWQREMGGRSSALVEQVWINRHPFSVVGVTPPSFFGLEVGRRFDIAVPLCAEPIVNGEGSLYESAKGWWLGAIGRLKSGVTVDTASAQLAAMSPALLQATIPPEYNSEQRQHYLELRLGAQPFGTGYSTLRRQYDRPLWILLSISGLVLLIACANLANLILARATAREREIAVRLALGASQTRLLRQLLAESLLLALLGAVIGTGFAQALSRALVPFLGPRNAQIFLDLHIDWRVLGFTVAVAIVTCLLFGLSPALHASRLAPAEIMNAGGRGVLSSMRSRFGFRRLLVGAQVALSLTLVIASLLFVRTFTNLLKVDPGLPADRILVVDADFSNLKIPAEQRLAYKQQLTDAVAGVPGVQGVGRNRFEPVIAWWWNDSINIPSVGTSKGESWFNQASPGYFAAVGTSLLAGREFTEHDNAGAPKAAIITRTFATKLFHEPAPIGKTFGVVQYGSKPDVIYEVVGVCQDMKYGDLRSDDVPIAFLPDTQTEKPEAEALLMVRSGLSADVLIPQVRNALLGMNPNMVLQFSRLKDDIADGLVAERLMAMLAGFFGGLAIVLAIVGLYGVISYMAARRTNEIGIRIALGADRGDILGMIMKDAAAMSCIGILAGLALAAALGPAARALLFGMKPTDPATLLIGSVAVAMIAALASAVPAIRAARLNPVVALHEE